MVPLPILYTPLCLAGTGSLSISGLPHQLVSQRRARTEGLEGGRQEGEMPSCLLVVLPPLHRAQAAHDGLQSITTLLEASSLQPSGCSSARGQTPLQRAGPQPLGSVL